jgi:hypothetical protein
MGAGLGCALMLLASVGEVVTRTSGNLSLSASKWMVLGNRSLSTGDGNVTLPTGFDLPLSIARPIALMLVSFAGVSQNDSASLTIELADAQGNVIAAPSFSTPVQLLISSSAAKSVCVYYDPLSGRWSTAGVQSVGFVAGGNQMQCSTTHFSVFSTSEPAPANPGGSSTVSVAAIAGGVAGGVVFVALLIAFIVWFVRRRRTIVLQSAVTNSYHEPTKKSAVANSHHEPMK